MTTKIKPGLLVALRTSITGGVHYDRTDLEAEGENERKWLTTCKVDDPEELERAKRARAGALREIRSVCTLTNFGLLCPESAEAQLDAAIIQARLVRDQFNASASSCQIDIFVLKGRVASSDAEAARAVGQEVADLIADMSSAIDRLDARAIRDAAQKARAMSALLEPAQADAVNTAVETARRAARTIVRRIEKEGEEASVVLADIQRGGIEKARMAFLDIEPAAPEQTPAMPAVAVQRFADLAGGEVANG